MCDASRPINFHWFGSGALSGAATASPARKSAEPAVTKAGLAAASVVLAVSGRQKQHHKRRLQPHSSRSWSRRMLLVAGATGLQVLPSEPASRPASCSM